MRVRTLVLFLFVLADALLAFQSTTSSPPVKVQGVLLGTGFPAPDPERAGPSNAVLVGDKVFIVDTGRGVTMRLAALQRRPSRLDAVFLTHLHSDHTADLPDLFATTWIMGRSKPLELYGPQGTVEMAAGVKQFLAEDIHIRRDLTEMLPAAGAEINVHVVQPGIVYDDGEVKVIAFTVDHDPVKPAFGYRFESHGRAIVFSGDYHPHEDTVRAVRGADVLVSEVSLPEFFDRVQKAESAERLKRYHCTPEQAAELAAKAGVRKLIFTHIIPADGADEILRRARKVFAGEIVVGADLMKF
jgi:ribonuclease Z